MLIRTVMNNLSCIIFSCCYRFVSALGLEFVPVVICVEKAAVVVACLVAIALVDVENGMLVVSVTLTVIVVAGVVDWLLVVCGKVTVVVGAVNGLLVSVSVEVAVVDGIADATLVVSGKVAVVFGISEVPNVPLVAVVVPAVVISLVGLMLGGSVEKVTVDVFV